MKKTIFTLSLIVVFSVLGCTEPAPTEQVKESEPTQESISEDRQLPIQIDQAKRAEIFEEQESAAGPKAADIQQKTLDQLKTESAKLKSRLEESEDSVGSHYVVVGSFGTEIFQKRMENKIKKEELEYRVIAVTVRGEELNTIKIGPIDTIPLAKKLLRELKAKGFPKDSFVQ